MSPKTVFQRRLRGFTLIELLVVVAIIGLLIGLLLPATQAAREAARATECLNRLKQLGTATLMFHDANQAFPPARLWDTEIEITGAGYPSWVARVLPYLEETAAHDGWDFGARFSQSDESLRCLGVKHFICPTRRAPHEAIAPPGAVHLPVSYPCGCMGLYQVLQESGAVADYGANHGDLTGDFVSTDAWYLGGNGTGVIVTCRPKRSGADIIGWRDRVDLSQVTDGTSKTTLAGEMFIPPDKMLQGPFDGPMYNGRDLSASSRFGGPGGAALARSANDPTLRGWALSFGSWHPGYCPFVWADGSVRRMSVDIDQDLYAMSMNRHDGGETVKEEPVRIAL